MAEISRQRDDFHTGIPPGGVSQELWGSVRTSIVDEDNLVRAAGQGVEHLE